jgi:hypothetical protein
MMRSRTGATKSESCRLAPETTAAIGKPAVSMSR